MLNSKHLTRNLICPVPRINTIARAARAWRDAARVCVRVPLVTIWFALFDINGRPEFDGRCTVRREIGRATFSIGIAVHRRFHGLTFEQRGNSNVPDASSAPCTRHAARFHEPRCNEWFLARRYRSLANNCSGFSRILSGNFIFQGESEVRAMLFGMFVHSRYDWVRWSRNFYSVLLLYSW